MKAGEFDRRVTFQPKTETKSATGSVSVSWGDGFTVWAKRLGSKGREAYAAGRELATVDEVFHVRWSSAVAAVDPVWRLMFEGRPYNIAAIVEVGRRQLLAVTCTRGANDG